MSAPSTTARHPYVLSPSGVRHRPDPFTDSRTACGFAHDAAHQFGLWWWLDDEPYEGVKADCKRCFWGSA